MVEQGMDLIIAPGAMLRTAVEKVAKEFPDKKFVHVGSVVDLPNVRTITHREQEGSFLAGCAAALASKTKKVGFIGGMQIPVIEKFQVGFEAGAKAIDKNIQVLPAKFLGSFDNVDGAKIAANVLYGQGADVIYAAAGGATLGVLRAAKEHGKLAIGVDSNQDGIYPGFVLTSMLKNCDQAVCDAIKELQEGHYKSGVYIYGLKEDGVRLTDMQYTRDKISPEGHAQIEEFRKKVASGEIQVPATKTELAEYFKKNGF